MISKLTELSLKMQIIFINNSSNLTFWRFSPDTLQNTLWLIFYWTWFSHIKKFCKVWKGIGSTFTLFASFMYSGSINHKPAPHPPLLLALGRSNGKYCNCVLDNDWHLYLWCTKTTSPGVYGKLRTDTSQYRGVNLRRTLHFLSSLLCHSFL